MSSNPGNVQRVARAGVAAITFDRPSAHNAMTWQMYEQLQTHCREIASDASIRTVTLRGVGGKAFVAGTDIEQFLAFRTGEDGLAYERRIDAVVELVEALPQPTLAIIEGWCMGGGLAIAAVCDFRIATETAKFGVPIARTVGNCLSIANTKRLVAAVGAPLAKRMLIGAESLDAAQALHGSFISEIVPADALDGKVEEICKRLASQAPLTMRVAKEAIRRIQNANLPDGDDLIKLCYGSEDFREGIESFVAKRKPQWRGR